MIDLEIVCSDYLAAAREFNRPEEQRPASTTVENYGHVLEAANRKAKELGYKSEKMEHKIVSADEFFFIYFGPLPRGTRVGGDLIIILDKFGKVVCWHRGA